MRDEVFLARVRKSIQCKLELKEDVLGKAEGQPFFLGLVSEVLKKASF